MSTQQSAKTRNPIAKWSIFLGTVALLGSLLDGLSKGGSFVFVVALAILVGLSMAIVGAIVGLIIRTLSMSQSKMLPVLPPLTPINGVRSFDRSGLDSHALTTPEDAPVPIHHNSSAAPSEEVWALAMAEFDGLARRAGMWAKAYATAHGDESKAKAHYLEWRATELQHEREVLAQATARQRQEAEAQRLRSINARCPSCEKTITMADSHCPYCRASFDLGSPYKLTPLFS